MTQTKKKNNSGRFPILGYCIPPAVRICKQWLNLIGSSHCLAENSPTCPYNKSWENDRLLPNILGLAGPFTEQIASGSSVHGQLLLLRLAINSLITFLILTFKQAILGCWRTFRSANRRFPFRRGKQINGCGQLPSSKLKDTAAGIDTLIRCMARGFFGHTSLVGHECTCALLWPRISWRHRAAPGSGRIPTILLGSIQVSDSWLWTAKTIRVRPLPSSLLQIALEGQSGDWTSLLSALERPRTEPSVVLWSLSSWSSSRWGAAAA